MPYIYNNKSYYLEHLYVPDTLPGIFSDIIYIHGNPVKYVLSSFYRQGD